MGLKTGIEWTDATWNPVTGCTKVTAGCDHCYAEALAKQRLREIYLRRPPVIDTPQNHDDPFAVRLWKSGPVRRVMEPAWAESIRDQCVQHGVPFFFKQWGVRTPKAGGRLLDDREWDEMPAVAAAT